MYMSGLHFRKSLRGKLAYREPRKMEVHVACMASGATTSREPPARRVVAFMSRYGIQGAEPAELGDSPAVGVADAGRSSGWRGVFTATGCKAMRRRNAPRSGVCGGTSSVEASLRPLFDAGCGSGCSRSLPGEGGLRPPMAGMDVDAQNRHAQRVASDIAFGGRSYAAVFLRRRHRDHRRAALPCARRTRASLLERVAAQMSPGSNASSAPRRRATGRGASASASRGVVPARELVDEKRRAPLRHARRKSRHHSGRVAWTWKSARSGPARRSTKATSSSRAPVDFG